jgi:hypothetical protein
MCCEQLPVEGGEGSWGGCSLDSDDPWILISEGEMTLTGLESLTAPALYLDIEEREDLDRSVKAGARGQSC